MTNTSGKCGLSDRWSHEEQLHRWGLKERRGQEEREERSKEQLRQRVWPAAEHRLSNQPSGTRKVFFPLSSFLSSLFLRINKAPNVLPREQEPPPLTISTFPPSLLHVLILLLLPLLLLLMLMQLLLLLLLLLVLCTHLAVAVAAAADAESGQSTRSLKRGERRKKSKSLTSRPGRITCNDTTRSGLIPRSQWSGDRASFTRRAIHLVTRLLLLLLLLLLLPLPFHLTPNDTAATAEAVRTADPVRRM